MKVVDILEGFATVRDDHIEIQIGRLGQVIDDMKKVRYILENEVM